MPEGNPQCPLCNGRGGRRGPYGWLRCECTRPTEEQKRLQRRMNSIGAKNPKGDTFRRALAQMELDEVAAEAPLTTLLDIIERALVTSGVKVLDRKDRALLVDTSKGKHMIGIQHTL